MQCPACDTPTLHPQKDARTQLEIDTCSSCQGLWFDPSELSRYLESAHNRVALGVALESEGVAEPKTLTINTQARSCPRCVTYMEARLFGGICLDRCPACAGLWFDQDELLLVVQQFRKGAHGDRLIAEQLREGLGDVERDAEATKESEARALDASIEAFLSSLTEPK
jgi:Zn-finger nucleic acid-binding protein